MIRYTHSHNHRTEAAYCTDYHPLLHLHPGLGPLVQGDGEVQPYVDDGQEVEQEEGSYENQGFRQHSAVWVGEPAVTHLMLRMAMAGSRGKSFC